MRRAPLAAFATAAAALLLAPAPAAAQPECVFGTTADYVALGAGGCRFGGIHFADFFFSEQELGQWADDVYVVPRQLHGITGFDVFASDATGNLRVTSEGATPGLPYVLTRHLVFRYTPVNVTSASVAIHPDWVSGYWATSTPDWQAFAYGTLSSGPGAPFYSLSVQRRSLGGPPTAECSASPASVPCDLASLQAAYAGGSLQSSLTVQVINFSGTPGTAEASAVAVFTGLVGAQVVPEPGTWLLVATGLAGVVVLARGRRRG